MMETMKKKKCGNEISKRKNVEMRMLKKKITTFKRRKKKVKNKNIILHS